jgi:hypothetical protein
MQSGRFSQCPAFLLQTARAGQKVQRKIAVAVQSVKPLYFLSRSFEIREKYCQQSSCCFSHQTDQGEETEGFEREGLEMER